MSLSECDRYLEEREQEHLEAIQEFLRIPSVSALPEHQGDVRRAAEWLADYLRRIGVPEVELLPTERNPVVFGAWHVDDAQPTAMIYGHYDVQPPDPLDLWTSPPFEPQLRDGKLYARGASDDKGNVMVALQGVEALVRTQGRPPINLKFFFEGEEEIGSPSLPAFMPNHREKLACDFIISADGGQPSLDQPGVTLTAKGIAACQVNVRTAATDLHSGMFGAAVPNAAQVTAHLAASFHTPDGRVAVEGFYDRVRELSEEERAELAAAQASAGPYWEKVGAPALWGEPGYSPGERVAARPTLDINGIWSGFQGAGVKTVTPAEGHFKITCRLVADQNPEEILTLIERHVEKHCPPWATATVERFPGSARPFGIRRDHPALKTAMGVLEQIFGKPPVVARQGGTIPVAEIFQRELGADMVFFAFGTPDGNVHAPNESMRLESMRRGRRAYCAYLTALAK
ncbi:dipeptidase [Sphaerobacter sp.]|uniref:dipeptidase n=1 Tax=Sphaerobacter sp. TaxID=2099654 RepID=UPI001D249727|nr:dipeptidase [Sphaerobacter sp.]MBX5445592.1 dipeptidase [Sphaerobacter sp.]